MSFIAMCLWCRLSLQWQQSWAISNHGQTTIMRGSSLSNHEQTAIMRESSLSCKPMADMENSESMQPGSIQTSWNLMPAIIFYQSCSINRALSMIYLFLSFFLFFFVSFFVSFFFLSLFLCYFPSLFLIFLFISPYLLAFFLLYLDCFADIWQW